MIQRASMSLEVPSDLLAIAAGRAERAVVAAAAQASNEAVLSIGDLAELALYARRASILLDQGNRPQRITAQDLGLDRSW